MKTLALAAALAVLSLPALAGDWRDAAEPMTPAQMEATQGKDLVATANALYLQRFFGSNPYITADYNGRPYYYFIGGGGGSVTVNAFVVTGGAP